MATSNPAGRIARPMAPAEAAASALRTIRTEREGLTALADALADGLAAPFASAVELIRGRTSEAPADPAGAGAGRAPRRTGRVIVTGLGKSGHIGRKIAATLASTGTPAFFVHPAEASHGDLGMITADDVVLALSWSGETAELRSVLEYARRFGIDLIAMTSAPESSLGRESDIVLALPRSTEACPHGLAPTTSTLMQLALGDALAIALLESRGFTADRFRDFHPGGRLGASLHFVRAIMHQGDALPLVRRGTMLGDAVPRMSEKGFGCLGVVDGDGFLVGIVTDGDLRRSLAGDLLARPVDAVMNAMPKTIAPDTLVGEALAMMNTADRPFTVLFVVEERRPIGIVHMHDFLRLGAA